MMHDEVKTAARNLIDAGAEIALLRRQVNEGIEVAHDLSVENERLQRRVEELEAEVDARRMRIEALEHGRDVWSTEVLRLKAEVTELWRRAEEAEGRAAFWAAKCAEAKNDHAATVAALKETRKRAEEAEARAGRRTLRHVKPFQWEAGRLCHGGTPAHWRCDACGAPLCDLHAAPGPLEHGCPERPAGRNSGFSLWPVAGFDDATAIEKARQEERAAVLSEVALARMLSKGNHE